MRPRQDVLAYRDDPSARPVAVVEMLQELELPGAARLLLIGADLWSSWFEVRWALKSDDQRYHELHEEWWSGDDTWRWWAEDTAGRRYDSVPGSGRRRSGALVRISSVRPRVGHVHRDLILHVPLPPSGEHASLDVAIPAR
jgi:hypothetical protein